MAAMLSITSWLSVFSLQMCNVTNGHERENMGKKFLSAMFYQSCLFRHNEVTWNIKVYPAMQF